MKCTLVKHKHSENLGNQSQNEIHLLRDFYGMPRTGDFIKLGISCEIYNGLEKFRSCMTYLELTTST